MVRDMNRTAVAAIVKEVVDKHDLERLLYGSPDEYDRETDEVVKLIEREGPVTAHGLAKALRLIFFWSYHMWTHDNLPRLQYYKPMAKELWTKLPKECRYRRQSSTSTKTHTTRT
jgi:hypothetical protein